MKNMSILFLVFLSVCTQAAEPKVISTHEYVATSPKNNIVEEVCMGGYVFLNIYQKRPHTIIQHGMQRSLLAYPVLVSTIQFFVNGDKGLEAVKC